MKFEKNRAFPKAGATVMNKIKSVLQLLLNALPVRLAALVLAMPLLLTIAIVRTGDGK